MSSPRHQQGMTFVEVLGAILIVMLVSELVFVGVQLSVTLAHKSERITEATRLGQNKLTQIGAALASQPPEQWIGESDLGKLLQESAGIVETVGDYSYTLTIWPITVEGGKVWNEQQLGVPMVRLAMGEPSAASPTPTKLKIPSLATYAFENQNYSGNYSLGPRPDDCLGQLEIVLREVSGSVYPELTTDVIVGKVRMRMEPRDGSGLLACVVSDMAGANTSLMRTVLVVDTRYLGAQTTRLQVVNRSKSQLIVKLVGTPEQVAAVSLLPVSEVGQVSVATQSQQVGAKTYLLRLSVSDPKGEVLKEFWTLYNDGVVGGTSS